MYAELYTSARPHRQAEEMAAERHALESSVIEMNTHGAQIERWLRDNESKTPTGQPVITLPSDLPGHVEHCITSNLTLG